MKNLQEKEKGKKQCENFGKGDNYKKHMKSTTDGTTWNKKRGR